MVWFSHVTSCAAQGDKPLLALARLQTQAGVAVSISVLLKMARCIFVAFPEQHVTKSAMWHARLAILEDVREVKIWVVGMCREGCGLHATIITLEMAKGDCRQVGFCIARSQTPNAFLLRVALR
eukprot:4198093-Amphidinium_carterae.2